MKYLNGIEPAEVWRWFEELCAIPRPSGSEERVADFLQDFAGRRDLECLRDNCNNVLIRKKGMGTAADNPPLVLQAHVDMVAEKSAGSEHDFSTDPIRPVIDNGRVTSPETTLGADNGIGVALMLAILDSDDLDHPMLECLFTTDEERGLTGAAGLDPAWITARRMINLDSEDEETFTIGCAGGSDFSLEMPVQKQEEHVCSILRISGLKGGHSGIEIHKNRGNAIAFLARFLGALSRGCDCLIADVSGGSKRNAIPREAEALVALPECGIEKAEKIISAVKGELREEYRGIDDEFSVTLEHPGAKVPVMDSSTSFIVINLLSALPHGVVKMSGVIPGLVETSVNLALLSTRDDRIEVVFSCRSPLKSARAAMGDRLQAICSLAGCRFFRGGSYPGWMPDAESELLGKMSLIYRSMFNKDPNVESIHAGLECGIIGDRVGGMDMISIGPDIRDVHVPGESVGIESMQRFWEFIKGVLKRLD